VRNVPFFILILIFCAPTILVAEDAQDAAFVRSINDQGRGATFDRAILLKDTADYGLCDSFECAEKVFNETVFKNEIIYVTSQFGQLQRDWELAGQGEVTAYIFGVSRYYDDLSIRKVATGRKYVLHFDITSSVDALKQKEYSIDSPAASSKWNRGLFY